MNRSTSGSTPQSSEPTIIKPDEIKPDETKPIISKPFVDEEIKPSIFKGGVKSKYTDRKFKVVTETAKITDSKTPSGFGGTLTEEESLELIKSILKLPHLFVIPKIPERSDEQLKPFVKELYLYCQKKQINLRNYVFDEFGLVVAASALGVGYYNDYRKYYKGDAKDAAKKHTDDYQHAIDVDKLNKNLTNSPIDLTWTNPPIESKLKNEG